MAFLVPLAAGLSIAASGLGIGLGVKSMIDSSKGSKEEEEEPYDPKGGFLKGYNTGGSTDLQEPESHEMPHLGATPSIGSMGRPLALEDDPVLNQPSTNSDNFIF